MSDQFKEQVRDRSDLVEVISQYNVPLKRAGRSMKACCPFHDEKTPSFVVSPEQGIWRCYGACNKGGDVFAFVQETENVDFVEALKILAQRAGLEMPSYTPEPPEKKQERHSVDQVMNLAAEYYHLALLNAPGAAAHREMLEKRGFTRDFWETWMAGAAGSNNGLNTYFQQRGVDIALAIKIGLLHEDGSDFFRDRIMLPFVENGQVKYFSGRAVGEDKPKYLHQPVGELIHKVPYNGKTGGKNLVLSEGPFDVWALDALAPKDWSALALCGLSVDTLTARAAKRREKVVIGVDSDGAGMAVVDKTALAVGAEKAMLIQWPGGDDPAAWFETGATAEQFAALLETTTPYLDKVLDEVRAAESKTQVVEKAIKIAVTLPGMHCEEFASKLKKATRGAIGASYINEALKAARVGAKPGIVAKGAPDEKPQFWISEQGDIWGGGDDPRRITKGGHALYVKSIEVDNGQEVRLEMEAEIRLTGRPPVLARVRATDMGDENSLIKKLKEVAGVWLTIQAGQKRFLPSAMEELSKEKGIVMQIEISRTGWVETDAGLAYVTPGGIIGELPEGYSVKLPSGFDGFDKIRVNDDGDEAFEQGIDGLLNGFLKSFPPDIVFPLLAFALTPVAARWLPEHKMALHLSGETGALKTHTAKAIMALYGDFADSPPFQTWRSTTNALEMTGFWLPDMIGLVDDYKPSIVKRWDLIDLIHRYADGNTRVRLNAEAELRKRQSMRWWLLSTGEDIPIGESSVLARMLTIRFPRRPQGQVYNAELAKAQRLAKFFPTITARWAKWLMENGADQGFDASLALNHQTIGALIQKQVGGAPNASRVAKNLAMLKVVWSAFCTFLEESGAVSFKETSVYLRTFADVVNKMAVEVARNVEDEKPTKTFLDAVQQGLDSGRFTMLPRTSDSVRPQGFVGFYDEKGVYLLPSSYNDVGKWLRESGQQLGFYPKELYRLLHEEGLLAAKDTNQHTVPVSVGAPGSRLTVRVLHLTPKALNVRNQPADDGNA